MMKGGGGGGGKRRWKGLVIAILGLVILSMLVPLGFLFGRFHSASTAGKSINFLIRSHSRADLLCYRLFMLLQMFLVADACFFY